LPYSLTSVKFFFLIFDEADEFRKIPYAQELQNFHSFMHYAMQLCNFLK